MVEVWGIFDGDPISIFNQYLALKQMRINWTDLSGKTTWSYPPFVRMQIPFRMAVKKENLPILYDRIQPYNRTGGSGEYIANFGASMLRKALRLKKISVEPNTRAVHREPFMNIILLGEREDKYSPNGKIEGV